MTKDHLNLICVFHLISKYNKFGLLVDLFEMMSKPNTTLALENLIKWVFVKVFEQHNLLEQILATEYWTVSSFF